MTKINKLKLFKYNYFRLVGPNLKSNQDTADSVIGAVLRSVFNKSPGARDSSGALAASVFATRFQKRHCKQIKLINFKIKYLLQRKGKTKFYFYFCILHPWQHSTPSDCWLGQRPFSELRLPAGHSICGRQVPPLFRQGASLRTVSFRWLIPFVITLPKLFTGAARVVLGAATGASVAGASVASVASSTTSSASSTSATTIQHLIKLLKISVCNFVSKMQINF